MTRFARSAIHQNTNSRELRITLTVYRDGRLGQATGNQDDGESLQHLVDTAVHSADRSPVSPQWPGVAGPTSTPIPDGWYESTAMATPLRRAELAAAACRELPGEALGFGGVSTAAVSDAVVSTRGLALTHRRTSSELRLTVHHNGRAGYTAALVGDVDGIQARPLTDEALRLCSWPAATLELPSGEVEAVLSPHVVGRILELLSAIGFSASTHRAQQSFMRLGDRIMSEGVSIWDDGGDPDGIRIGFDSEGTRKQRVDLVTHGQAMGLLFSRGSASEAGRDSTGHAAPSTIGAGEHAANLFMAEGNRSFQEVLAPIRQGILITRLHYATVLDAASATIGGVTRDGTLLIRDGRICGTLPDLRVRTSLLKLLSSVREISRERRLLAQMMDGFVFVPAVSAGGVELIGWAG
jgi:predicted Zn-dependent protease